MTELSAASIAFRDARVLDGSGRPPFTASVRVADGRIDAISEAPLAADRVVDLDPPPPPCGFSRIPVPGRN